MTALEKAVLADETFLRPYIGKFQSRYVTDGLLRSVLQLPDAIRDPLLPPLPLLKLEQRHSVGRITYIDHYTKHLLPIDRVMSSVLDQKNKSELRFHLKPIMAGKPGLAIPEDRETLENIDVTSVVVVLDSSVTRANEKDVKCLTNQQLKEGSYLGVYHPYDASHKKTNLHCRDGQPITLSPGEG
ncbi:hypothetical protein [Endozoicomonas sp. SCSIO W0465]|uniref:hypothetical protein n=1 Tax=Endozoicomonas sp. SCSIO W0465 TaxID=2918516 RepID=UPI0020751622|nr:hypothetical protein [Endozoicomonas sp. SCSIO W0465]USE38448.1 hypothetical protein MJO57_09920 [Endozoicomonas sp. SCSIO W0465]